MDEGPVLSIHEDGLLRVLSEWSGVGALYKAIAAMGAITYEREWSPRDVERRAMRILLLECSPLLRRWPASARAWNDYLPTLSVRHRFWADVPQTRVDWVKTRRKGWPPSSFAIRRRHRSTDQVTLSVLAWTLRRLKLAFEASQELVGPDASLAQELASDVERVITQSLPILELLEETDEPVPSRDDINAVRAAGWPWRVVGDVANVFLGIDRGGAEVLARRLLHPDGFPESVFQLSVLGAVLIGCEEMGATITSLRPIGHLTDGPVYRVDLRGEEPWELWCEAAQSWKEYGLEDRYQRLALTLQTGTTDAFQAKSIRPDILLARRGDRAVVFECKFPAKSLDAGYVAHGLYQAAFYAHQLKPAFQRVLGIAVGPDELSSGFAHEPLGQVRIGLAGPSTIPSLVSWLIADVSQSQDDGPWPLVDYSFSPREGTLELAPDPRDLPA